MHTYLHLMIRKNNFATGIPSSYRQLNHFIINAELKSLHKIDVHITSTCQLHIVVGTVNLSYGYAICILNNFRDLLIMLV